MSRWRRRRPRLLRPRPNATGRARPRSRYRPGRGGWAWAGRGGSAPGIGTVVPPVTCSAGRCHSCPGPGTPGSTVKGRTAPAGGDVSADPVEPADGLISGLSTFRPYRRGGLVDKHEDWPASWWTSPLCESASNIHSKSCPKGPTFTVEPDRGAISGTVPGDRADDRKAAGNGPGGGSTIASNRDCRCASRQTAGSFGRFCCPPRLPWHDRRRLLGKHATAAASTTVGMDGLSLGLAQAPGRGSQRTTRRPSEVRRCGAATAAPRRRYSRSAGSFPL